MPQVQCPTRDELSTFVVGKMPPDQREAIDEHLDNCFDCQAILETVDSASDTLVVKLRQPSVESEYDREDGMRESLEIIAAIGREPSFTSAAGVAEATESAEPQTVRDYQLLEKLGEGGMGAVYKALHTKLKKVVALKILPAERLKDANAVDRFHREMEAVGKLSHPNIVGAHDAGEVDDMHYLVMEIVDGIDLSKLARRIGPLPVADACEIIRQAADGLQHAYEEGMVHRDIKPSNLMLTTDRKREPVVKILDMGLALLDDQQASAKRDLTTTGQMMGTLDYMAPEQGTDSHEVDIRADIYSLGATLFKLLSGEPPFPSSKYNTPVKLMMAKAMQDAPSIASVLPDLPEELTVIIDRIVAKNPDDRFSTPEEVAAALEPFVDGCDLVALLESATPEQQDVDVDQSAVRTSEHLSSGSVDTQPTIDHAPNATLNQDAPDSAATAATSPSAQQQPAPQNEAEPSRRSTGWTRNRVITLAAAVGGIILLGAVTLFFRSKDGTIVVEIDDPDGLIQVTVEGEDIVITDKKNEGQPIKLKSLDCKLQVKRGDLEFTTDNFTLNRGDKNIVTVKLVDGQVKVIQEDTVIKAEPLPNYALAFDGKSSYVKIPSIAYGGGKITVEATVTMRAQGNSRLITAYAPNRSAIGLGMSYERHPHFYRKNGGRVSALTSRQDDIVGRTLHLAGVYDDYDIKLFVNGKLCDVAPTTSVSSANHPEIGVHVGAVVKSNSNELWLHLNGTIDEVRISKVARYDKDFTPLKPGERFKPDKHTLALYHFDDGPGSKIARDSSPNKHHGTIHGAKFVPAYDRVRRREALAWVLRKGGRIGLHLGDGQGIREPKTVNDLPDQEFTVSWVDFETIRLSDDELTNLAPLTSLRHLGLAATKITDKGLVHLSHLSSLRILWIDRNEISDAGLAHLRDLRNIEAIRLDGTRISGEGLEHLANWHNLKNLALGSNSLIDDESLKVIATFRSLEVLRLSPLDRVTVEGVAKLRLALPDCKIESDFTDEQIKAAMEKLKEKYEGGGMKDEEE